MSAISLLLLATAATSAAVGGAALHSARGLRRRLEECPRDAHTHDAKVPRARSAEEIRSIVVEAIAEERERELAEARALWAAQETGRDGTPPVDGTTLAGRGTEYEVAPLLDALLGGRLDDDALAALRELRDRDADRDLRDLRGLGDIRDAPQPGIFVPRQIGRDLEGTESLDGLDGPDRLDGSEGTESLPEPAEPADADGREHPDLAAARRRHPSEPDFTLRGEPAEPSVPAQAPPRARSTAGHEHTVGRLAELAEARTPLADVRQGPLGTLDVYLFQDGTTVCLSPGHRETAEALCEALREGDVPVLMGGSTVSGAYALTFAYGEGRTAYLLADRVIASR
ncbi:hypothetical protein K378_03911 [Streptomyces sp. Amel2xB2]|uniref:hypothetical protein n=1 Tax=Streptomyces sp. Amel2xB2 TaxID=1305829 RepID=UPI000DB91AE4|nr:hypothetical protein [Streptomyces sp. Amel2xB2]RAJ62558.1 hypothetical protein K378_03911 [Streptomyces sp. Amel2xB2]